MHLKIAVAALATAGAILAATPHAASAASIGAGAFAAHERLDNRIVEEVGRRWRHARRHYRRNYYNPYYSYYQPYYYRPYYRPYYYGAYGYPSYGYYRPYYGPGFYGRFYGPRFGFSIGY
jgi:hypothetical protein